ncbi:hypothetical protein [Planococcus sp. 4-30]|nr:hypothetical protein [Planococcus sp. 4-30]
MKKVIKISMKFLFGVIGIVLISVTPALFGGAICDRISVPKASLLSC